MKKRVLTILSLILIGTLVVQNNRLGLFDKKVAYAIGDLSVLWDSTPLFNESNIAPGFNVTKNVNVANGAPSSRPVGVRGILTSDPGNMKSVMHIRIKEGSTTLYDQTLAQFFADSAGLNGIPLSNLGSGTNTNYSFKVAFDSGAGNEFQNKSIVFNLQIGIAVDLPAACESINFGPSSPIFGTAGNDNITGTTQNDLIITFEGADKVSSGLGDDCVITQGGGNDKVSSGGGNDVIFTADGNDDINSGVGNDFISAGNGNNKVSAGVGNDQVTTGSGNDDINLGTGNDIANAGGGNDKVVGGTGNDTINGEAGNDDLEGGSGNDTLIGGPDFDKAKGGSGIDTCDAEIETNCEI